jgi:hypothetical protein
MWRTGGGGVAGRCWAFTLCSALARPLWTQWSRQGAAGAGPPARPRERLLHLVQPAQVRLRGEDVVAEHEPGGHVRRVGIPAESGQVVQGALDRRPLPLNEIGDVHPRHDRRQGQLDDELVPTAVGPGDRSAPPGGHLVAAGVGEPPRPGRRGVVARAALPYHQAVALQALQGRRDLSDVQGPGLAGRRVEVLPQLVRRGRSPRQQREQSMLHGHVRPLAQAAPAPDGGRARAGYRVMVTQ